MLQHFGQASVVVIEWDNFRYADLKRRRLNVQSFIFMWHLASAFLLTHVTNVVPPPYFFFFSLND